MTVSIRANTRMCLWGGVATGVRLIPNDYFWMFARRKLLKNIDKRNNLKTPRAQAVKIEFVIWTEDKNNTDGGIKMCSLK